MQQPSSDLFFAGISASAAKLAEIAGSCDNGLPVPSCPDWTLRQLATHVGRVHRWVAEIVSTRSQAYIPFSEVPDGAYPAQPAARAEWLTAGARRVVEAVRAAGDEPVWVAGPTGPAGFWARRQAHETMVHRADAELTIGREPVLDQQLAADGIDEWLSMAARGRGDAGTRALPPGARLQLAVTGAGPAACWLVSGTGEGLSVAGGAGDADVTVSGPADRLLLVLLRRFPPGDPAVSVSGDAGLFAGWLAGTPF
jgi:uncharacterized protein (TIGR03083 family)